LATGARDRDDQVLTAHVDHGLLIGALVLDVAGVLARAALRHELEERRLRDVHLAGFDELRHLPEEERQEKRSDVRSVDVRVGHDDHLSIAKPGKVEIVAADARAERRDDRLDLLMPEHLVDPRLLDVEDLSADRKDRLELAHAALLGGSTCGVSLDDEELGRIGIAARAVRELPGEAAALKRRLPAHELARLASRFASRARLRGLVENRSRGLRVLLEMDSELLADD